MSDGEVGKEEVLSAEADGGASTDIMTNPKETTTAAADQQLSQSLAEDDSVSPSIKSGKSTFLSSSESAFSSTSTAVTLERKQVLLAQARADRLDWIRRVPLPYKSEGKASRNNDTTPETTPFEDVWQRDPRLAELKSTFVFQQSPSALQVLSHLYGIGREPETSENSNTSGDIETVSKRVGEILDTVNESDGDEDGKLAVPTAEQIRNTALAEEEGDPVLRAFNSWASKLSDPAAAVLVQGMRGFCRKIRNETGESLPPKLQGYLRLTFESLKDYAPWKETELDESARRSLESFVYGHIVDFLDILYWTDEVKKEERNWQHRLGSLQFVNPKHLEIHCLAEGTDEYNDIFRKPVEALLSVEKYFSPFEKLQRILAVYHNVNAALTEALNRSNDPSAAKKLPSADDVLPSIILTVLIARPSRLLLDLRLIEDFAPPEYLRGEAGYAYTNLYGAVQFLKDIDLDADKPESLDIDAEEFRSSLKACREATEAKHAQRKSTTLNLDAAEPEPVVSFKLEETMIPVADIRDARIRGQVVDIEWAKQRLSEKTGEGQQPKEELNGAKDKKPKDDSDELPAGFTRSYTFLSSRPEDIKLSDLPKLLAEYKMLVHTTESLLGEKIAKANAEKKAKLAAKQKEVYEAAKQIDPSLLPPVTSSSKRSERRWVSFG